MNKYLITIDPGKTFGWAFFGNGKLVYSGHCSQKAYFAGKLSAQAKRVGMQLPFCPSFNLDEDEWVLVAEKPNYRHQGDGERKATPNDLITLGIFLGELVALYRKNVDTVQLVTAHEWKGSLKKEICHARLEKLLGPDEKMPDNHNAKDAVGIGLHKLGRYRR